MSPAIPESRPYLPRIHCSRDADWTQGPRARFDFCQCDVKCQWIVELARFVEHHLFDPNLPWYQPSAVARALAPNDARVGRAPRFARARRLGTRAGGRADDHIDHVRGIAGRLLVGHMERAWQ